LVGFGICSSILLKKELSFVCDNISNWFNLTSGVGVQGSDKVWLNLGTVKTSYKQVLQVFTNHQDSSHVAQVGGSKMEDVTMGEAFGIVDTLVASVVGSGRVNPFKPIEGEVVLPSSFINHKGLFIKKMVSASFQDL
jgi:hypothetical protein